MKSYNVYFVIYDKKLKVKVEAVSKDQAERIVRNDLKIIKVEQLQRPLEDDTVLNDLKDIFGID